MIYLTDETFSGSAKNLPLDILHQQINEVVQVITDFKFGFTSDKVTINHMMWKGHVPLLALYGIALIREHTNKSGGENNWSITQQDLINTAMQGEMTIPMWWSDPAQKEKLVKEHKYKISVTHMELWNKFFPDAMIKTSTPKP